MRQPLRVVEDEDPRDVIHRTVGDIVKAIHPIAAQVLLVMYERGKQNGDVRTAGGIIVPHVKLGALAEDKIQGKVGLVVGLGPIAFTEDATHKWGDRVPQIDDWVIVNINDCFGFDLPGDRRARMVEDVNVRAVLDEPDVVW